MRIAIWIGWMVLAAACGRLSFDQGSPASDGDAGAGAPWHGPFTLEVPEPVVELNSPGGDTECTFTRDGLTVFFTSDRGGGVGSGDVYAAIRPDLDAPWQDVRNLDALNTSAWEGRVTTTPDGTTALFSSNRPDDRGRNDLWMGTRESTSRDFVSGDFAPLAISTSENDYDPWISPDGLRVYFVIDDGEQEIVFATRDSLADPFTGLAPVPGISSPDDEDNPYLSDDELFIVLGSNRAGSLGRKDLYYAERGDRSSPFSEPRPLPVVNTEHTDSEACFTRDGELYFSSDRPGGRGSDDIYRTRFVTE